MDKFDKAILILDNTRDGSDLRESELELVQAAVNGWLNEAGYEKFDELFNAIRGGTYQKRGENGSEQAHDH